MSASAPSPEAMINGKRATLFRAGPPPVYVCFDGRFAIHIAAGDKWIIKSSMKAIENEIARKRKFLKLMRVSDYGNNIDVRQGEAVAMTDTQYTDREGKKHHKGYDLFVLNINIVDRLIELEKRRAKYEKEIQKEKEKIMKNANRVNSNNFAAILELYGEEA